jgi:hypothetical protein
MELQHVNVKIFVDGPLCVDPERFLDLFHGWIQERALEELLVDVADYRHVHHGPGVVLVAHEADISMDQADGRWGLRYNRKAPVVGTNADRLAQAWRAALRACGRIEQALPPLKFSRRELEIFVNDRALAPNTPATLAGARPEIEAFLRGALGHADFSLEPRSDPRRLFGLTVRLGRPYDLPARG